MYFYSSTSDASYGQPQVNCSVRKIAYKCFNCGFQFFNPSMFSSNTAGISSGIQFTIGGGSGEQSVSE